MKPSAIRAVQELMSGVSGFLGDREGPYLYALAQLGAPLGVIVEIGRYKGKSTIWLGKGCQAVGGRRVFAVDPQNRGRGDDFRENIRRAGLPAIVVPMVMTSMEALEGWTEPIGLLWIDGNHSYESVAEDFYGWTPHVRDGGIVALHDTYSWEGVRKLVDEEILRRSDYRIVGQVDSILAVQKTSSMSTADNFRRTVTVHLRRIYNGARAQRKHWRALPRKVLRGLARPKFHYY